MKATCRRLVGGTTVGATCKGCKHTGHVLSQCTKKTQQTPPTSSSKTAKSGRPPRTWVKQCATCKSPTHHTDDCRSGGQQAGNSSTKSAAAPALSSYQVLEAQNAMLLQIFGGMGYAVDSAAPPKPPGGSSSTSNADYDLASPAPSPKRQQPSLPAT